jgi:hypothetical protein
MIASQPLLPNGRTHWLTLLGNEPGVAPGIIHGFYYWPAWPSMRAWLPVCVVRGNASCALVGRGGGGGQLGLLTANVVVLRMQTS